MKRRLSAVLLALGLSVSALSMGAYASDAANGQATETEVTQAGSETIIGGADEATAIEVTDEAEAGNDTQADTIETQLAGILTSALQTISGWTSEQISQFEESDDIYTAAVASNWKAVKSDLGAFVSVESAELSEDGTSITGHTRYEKTGENTDVTVTYTVNTESQSVVVNWEINYSFGMMMARAALNTLMGVGIVFLVLFFLTWLIGKLHYIPDVIEGKINIREIGSVKKKPIIKKTDDDGELTAVIAAAIAAYEQETGKSSVSAEGSEEKTADRFVVRSIKKSNKKSWQKA